MTGVQVNGKNLATFRARCGMTQQTLADEALISKRTVERLEKNGNTDYHTIATVASILEVCPSDLLADVGNALPAVVVIKIDESFYSSAEDKLAEFGLEVLKIARQARAIRLEIGSIILTILVTCREAIRLQEAYFDGRFMDFGVESLGIDVPAWEIARETPPDASRDQFSDQLQHMLHKLDARSHDVLSGLSRINGYEIRRFCDAIISTHPKMAGQLGTDGVPDLNSLNREIEIDLWSSNNEQVETRKWLLHDDFVNQRMDIIQTVRSDQIAVFEKSPSLDRKIDLADVFPCLKAVWIYRWASALHRLGLSVVPLIMSEYAKQLAMVEIHPSAIIGKSFAVMGAPVTVGAGVRVGERVTLYSGVVLRSWNEETPTLGDGVTVYANTTLEGDLTIEANRIVTADSFAPISKVPSRSTSMKKKRGSH